jgi:hypothetical protein
MTPASLASTPAGNESIASAVDRREFLNAAAVAGLLSTFGNAALAAAPMPMTGPGGADNFYRSGKVTVQKVGFRNQ